MNTNPKYYLEDTNCIEDNPQKTTCQQFGSS